MRHRVDEELRRICQGIVSEGKSEEDWALVESDDMIQVGKYEGGYDATEMEFCFSVYMDGAEYWLQFSLEQAKEIAGNGVDMIDIFPASTP